MLSDDLTPFFIDCGPHTRAPALTATRRLHRRLVAGALRAADAGHGGDGAGAARGGAGGAEDEA